MESRKLKILLDEMAGQIQEYISERQYDSFRSYEQEALQLSAMRLLNSLNVLLPPRGKATSVKCPHCGSDLDITITKA